MRTRASLLWTFCLILPLASACARDVPHPRTQDKSSLVFEGQLRTVDPKRQTVIVAFDDDLYEFAYTDDTEVVGRAAGVQGLTGNRGNEVTVHYRANPITSTKTAVRIEIQ